MQRRRKRKRIQETFNKMNVRFLIHVLQAANLCGVLDLTILVREVVAREELSLRKIPKEGSDIMEIVLASHLV